MKKFFKICSIFVMGLFCIALLRIYSLEAAEWQSRKVQDNDHLLKFNIGCNVYIFDDAAMKKAWKGVDGRDEVKFYFSLPDLKPFKGANDGNDRDRLKLLEVTFQSTKDCKKIQPTSFSLREHLQFHDPSQTPEILSSDLLQYKVDGGVYDHLIVPKKQADDVFRQFSHKCGVSKDAYKFQSCFTEEQADESVIVYYNYEYGNVLYAGKIHNFIIDYLNNARQKGGDNE